MDGKYPDYCIGRKLISQEANPWPETLKQLKNKIRSVYLDKSLATQVLLICYRSCIKRMTMSSLPKEPGISGPALPPG